MVPTTATATLDPHLALSADFAQVVRRHVDGLASDADLALLEANTRLWVRALYRLLDDVAESIDGVRATVRGHRRALIVADLEDDYGAIDAVLAKLVGPPLAPLRNGSSKDARSAGIVELQLSWVPGRVIAWAAGPGRTAEGAPEVLTRLRGAGAGTVEWSEHRPVKLGGGARAEAVSAPIESCLGWLVALGEAAEEDGIGASVSWLGLVAAMAVRLAAQGRMVPQLKKVRRRYRPDHEADGANGAVPAAAGRADSASYAVRWAPALVESDILAALTDSLPGAAAAFENQRDAPAFTHAALADIFDAIATEAAERLEAPAPPPAPRTRAGRGRDGPGPAGRHALRRPQPPRLRPGPPPRPVGTPGDGALRPAAATDRAARSTRRHRRLAPVGPVGGELGRAPTGRAGPGDRVAGPAPGGEAPDDPPGTALPRAATARGPPAGRGDPRRGRGVAADDRDRPRPAGRGLRGAGPSVVAPAALTVPAPHVGRGPGDRGGGPPAGRRALVGRLRRRGADCGRDPGSGRPGPAPGEEPGTVGGAGPGPTSGRPRPRWPSEPT